MRTTSSLFLSLASGLVLCAAGCSSGDMGTVTGTVHLDGEPLEGALVTFYPELENGADTMGAAGASMGRTDASGKYELVFDRDTKGAHVGKHLVYIETLEEGGGGDYGGGRAEEVPKRYNSESELHVEVTAGRNTIDFLDLTSDGEKNKARPMAGY